MAQLPLSAQLAALLYDLKCRQALRYCANHKSNGTSRDVFDGGAYLEKKDELFPCEVDIAISISVDGFNTNKTGSSLWIIHATILNFSPQARYGILQLLLSYNRRTSR